MAGNCTHSMPSMDAIIISLQQSVRSIDALNSNKSITTSI